MSEESDKIDQYLQKVPETSNLDQQDQSLKDEKYKNFLASIKKAEPMAKGDLVVKFQK